MVDEKLLAILCCPETKQDVHMASDSIVRSINTAIAQGTVENRAGEKVKEKIDGALVREDKKFIYLIRQDIPIMLIDEAVAAEKFMA